MSPARPFGRWNRAYPSVHVVEKISDGAVEWGICRTCDWQSTPKADGTTDADCEQHEREVFETAKAGHRITGRGIG